MMEDNGMHDVHQDMEHDHLTHSDHGADSLAQHHPVADHNDSPMGHMQHMMHSMTVSSLKTYNRSLVCYFNIFLFLCRCSSMAVVLKRFYSINGKFHQLVK